MDVTLYPWQRIKFHASSKMEVRKVDNLENIPTSQVKK